MLLIEKIVNGKRLFRPLVDTFFGGERTRKSRRIAEKTVSHCNKGGGTQTSGAGGRDHFFSLCLKFGKVNGVLSFALNKRRNALL